jgi:hypothetical protein
MVEQSTSTVIVQGDDAGERSTWFAWWLDEPDSRPYVWNIAQSVRTDALEALHNALPIQRSIEESAEESVHRAISSGALADYQRERDLAESLGAIFLPPGLCSEILERRKTGNHVIVRMTPAQSAVHVPWEILAVPNLTFQDGRRARLLELAEIVNDGPPAMHVSRARLPTPLNDTTKPRILRVVDPDTGGAAGSLFSFAQRQRLAEELDPANSEELAHGRIVTRDSISKVLCTAPGPDALLYVGHVVGSADDSGRSALLLSRAEAERSRSRRIGPGQTLTALDIVGGDFVDGANERDGDPRRSGPEKWPMPRAVAFIACNSGLDLGSTEPFGLVTACLNAGAAVVIATRWTLPTDRAFRDNNAVATGDPQPIADLAVATDRMLRSPDPARALHEWKRKQLARWLAHEAGTDLGQLSLAARSPLVWGAVTAHIAPARSPASSTLDVSGQPG